MNTATKGSTDMGSTTRRHPVLRTTAAAVVAIGLIAAACTTGPGGSGGPAQPTVDFVADANRLHVIDREDNWGDLPYLIHIGFRVQYGRSGSAEVWAVPEQPPELLTCPGTPDPLADPDDLFCIDTEAAAIPDSTGRIRFDDLKTSTLSNLAHGELPEIAGVLTFAFEHEWLFNGNNYSTDLMTTLIEDLLNQYIASGQLPTDANLAAPIIVDDTTEMLIDLFAELAIVLLFGGGILDSYIGMSPFVIAAVGGGLGNLLDAAGWNELPLGNGFAFITAHDSQKRVRYTEQQFGPFDIGSPNTIYDIDWDLHAE